MRFNGNPAAVQVRAMAERLGIRAAMFYPVVGPPKPALYPGAGKSERLARGVEVQETRDGKCLVFETWEAANAWLQVELDRDADVMNRGGRVVGE